MTEHRRNPNFYAGPAALPLEALERAQRELVDYQGTGLSILEHSHRGPSYMAVHEEAEALVRRIGGVPDDYRVLFLQGGARQQFAMIPMNLLTEGKSADYVRTGNWAGGAFDEAKRVGKVRLAANTEEGGTFTRIPTQDELDLDPKAAYVHITSNNTLYGTQWHTLPRTGAAPLVADLTSDLFCRPLDVSRYGLIYAGAQKNVGPAGVTVVIVKDSLVEAAPTTIPEVFRYATHAAKDSMWNTPPTFAIYMLRNTLEVLEARGGLAAMGAANEAKAQALYDVIDADPEFFRCPTEEASRSIMNVVFRLPTPELEAAFLAQAKERSMYGLKGHRKVGGLRASLYNWCERAWVDQLCELLTEFRKSA